MIATLPENGGRGQMRPFDGTQPYAGGGALRIPDLSLCRYHGGPFDANNWAVPLLAVGWLEHPYTPPERKVSRRFAAKLAALVKQSRAAFGGYCFLGDHECSLCSAEGRKSPPCPWSQENVFVPGHNCVYVAPGGIVHYVEVHGYVPPKDFITAALDCPPCDSRRYRAALARANLGVPPPLKDRATSIKGIRPDFSRLKLLELRFRIWRRARQIDCSDALVRVRQFFGLR